MKGTVMDESVKWMGKNVLPSRPQAVLLVERDYDALRVTKKSS
jgi:hypothetical protein